VIALSCFIVFVGVGVVLRAYLQRRRHGTWGIVALRPGQRVSGIALLMLPLLLGGQSVLAALAPERLPLLCAPRTVAGAALVLGATGLMLVAQLDLGASWRIGIDPAARPGLVTTGFYRFCRNPIYLFLLLVVAGFVLLLPTWISVGALAGAALGVELQARAEERYLLRTYGEAYRAYASQVGRFVPGLGRLPASGQ